MSTDNNENLDFGNDFTPTGEPAESPGEAAKRELAQRELEKAKAKQAVAQEDDGEQEEVEEVEEQEETEDERAEREAQEAAEREAEEKKKRARMPLSRHEEILRRNREAAAKREQALLDQIRQLQSNRGEAQQKSTLKEMATELEGLQDKYEDLVLDGKREEARAVRRQINDMQEQISDFRAATFSKAARVEAIETLKYEAALAKAESDYPELNPDNADTFDEDLTNEVAELADALTKSQKLPRHVAVARAAKYVLGAPKKIEDTAKKGAQDAANQRAIEARAKAAAAARQQPADTARAGKNNDQGGTKNGEVDLMRMSQDKFAKLDDETLARLRGDVL
jgi:hypothetical protein